MNQLTYATQLPAVPRKQSSAGIKDLYSLLVFGAMALGTVVFIEPAPIDAALMGLLLFGLLLHRVSFSALQIYPSLCMAIFTLANIGSMWEPIDFTRGIWYLIVTLYLMLSLLFFSGFINHYGLYGFRMLMAGYVVAGVISAVLASSSYFGIIPGQDILLVNGRPKGMFKDPNVFGPYLVPVALYAISKFEEASTSIGRRLLWVITCLISTAAVFLSYSRACWINFGVALALFMMLRVAFAGTAKEFAQRLRFIGVAVAALLVTLGLVLMIPSVSQMVELRLGSHGLQGYDQLRFYTHHLAWESTFNRPFGIGPGQAEDAFQYATHSTYLRILSENGILGAVGFFSLFAITFGRALYLSWKVRDPQWQPIFAVVAATIAGVVVNSGVIDTNHWRHIWLFLAIPWINRQWQWNAIATRTTPMRGSLAQRPRPLIYGEAPTHNREVPWLTR